MHYKQIFNVVGVAAVSAFFCVGCSEKADDDGNGGNVTFTDSRDNRNYRTVKVGNQTWFAENLNYDVPDVATDVCYENKTDNCAKYGRLYDWNTALTACPSGWHLPSDAEWDVLLVYVGGVESGKNLKSKTGWDNNGNGTDDVGFSALPGGAYNHFCDGCFDFVGEAGIWWTATEATVHNADGAWFRLMGSDIDFVVTDNYGLKKTLLSVRCVQE